MLGRFHINRCTTLLELTFLLVLNMNILRVVKEGTVCKTNFLAIFQNESKDILSPAQLRVCTVKRLPEDPNLQIQDHFIDVLFG